jgi:hypothetical protein
MKIFLDDLREPPPGWIKVTHPNDVTSHILQGEAEIIDLDYPLGNDRKYTGLTVMKWLQNEIGEGRIPARVPEFRIHTDDQEAKAMMEGIRGRFYKWSKRDIGE